MPSVTFVTIRSSRLIISFTFLMVLAAGALYLTSVRSSTNASVIRIQRIALTQSDAAQNTEPMETAVIGQPAPDFTLADLDGRPTSLSSFKGRPVLLYFWATWCHHCTKSLPELMDIQQEHEKNGLQILAVNILETEEKVATFMSRANIDLVVLLDGQALVSQTYLIRATPTYVLIDRHGILQDVIIGRPRPGVLDARLSPLLAPIQGEIATP